LSEIRVTTISDTAGTGPVTLTKQSAAKAWINMDGTGTFDSNTIRASFNVSGVTDNGTGDHSISFSSSFANANYAASMSSSAGALSNTDTMVNPYTWATGSTSIGTNNNAGSVVDRLYVNLSINGDLA